MRLYNVYRQHSAVLEFKDEPDVTRQINIRRKPFHTNAHLSAGLKRVASVCLFLVSNVFLTIHEPELNHICHKLPYLKTGRHFMPSVLRYRY